MNMWSLRYKRLLDYLGLAEGWYIHFNKGEKDVTAFYGCYRYAHPKFPGWIWLDQIAHKSHNANYRSSYNERMSLNKYIKNNPVLLSIYNDISQMFHYENTKNLGLTNFPDFKTAKTFFSLYTNSQRGGTRALQRALRKMGYTITVDGAIGKQTRAIIKAVPVHRAAELNKWMLHYMQRYYDALIRQNPLLYRKFSKGWTNRLKTLA